MKIAVLTYDHPHKKTQDLLYMLLMVGYTDITLIVSQWEDRPKHNPLYQHRPGNPLNIPTSDLCDRLNLKVTDKITDEFDKILIGGAGILPDVNLNIINSHPGYLPNVRGLDSLKWAILNGQPIGVTTHFIGSEPDTGVLIERRIIPLYFTDTFHSIAQRVYQTEIEMLVNALEIKPDGEQLKAYPEYEVNRRMNHYDEIRMMARLTKMLNSL